MAKYRTKSFTNYDDACRFAVRNNGTISGPFPNVCGGQTWIVGYYA